MRKTMVSRCLAILVLCVPVVSSCSVPPVPGPAAERTTLIAAAESFHAAARAKDREAVLDLFDPDAIMLPPGGDRVDGIEGVRGYRFGFLETPGIELDFEVLEAVVSATGDLGWTIAIADITIRGPEGVIGRDRVRDVHAWKRQPNGLWKIAIDVWNSAPPSDP